MNWILAAEGTGGNSNVLLPPTYELVIGTIAFFTIFFLLSKFALPNIKKTLEARTESIEGGIAKAEKMQQEASVTLAQYRQQLADARSEAAKIRSAAESERTNLISEARTEAQVVAQGVTQQANAQIAAEKSKAVNELRLDVSNLALDLASKIVGASLQDDQRAKAVIDQFIKDLESAGGKR
jgi:F-type H+-transporting ATPase subunit b